jgi:Mn-containing catalase
MSELRELLVEGLQDLLNAENQLVAALPKMAAAARNAVLKQAFGKHLTQTEGHVERLKLSLELLGEDEESKPCKGMKGLLEEGQEIIEDGKEMDELTADLALIAAAQKVEHYRNRWIWNCSLPREAPWRTKGRYAPVTHVGRRGSR